MFDVDFEMPVFLKADALPELLPQSEALPCDLVWFRRDLRVSDHAALSQAASHCLLCVYVLDPDEVKNPLHSKASTQWLLSSLSDLDATLRRLGSYLLVIQSKDAPDAIARLAEHHRSDHVYVNKGQSPQENLEEKQLLEKLPISTRLHLCGTPWLLDPDAVTTKEGKSYRVFTPYSKRCEELLASGSLSISPAPLALVSPCEYDLPYHRAPAPKWAQKMLQSWQVGEQAALKKLCSLQKMDYEKARQTPCQNTTLLSPHLAHGEVSAKQVMHVLSTALAHTKKKQAHQQMQLLFRQLLWREFAQYLWHHTEDFPYDDWAPNRLVWENPDPVVFEKWKKGQTGLPMVDAGMRQLWETGWMHNRVRMVVADFFCKHLGYDWRLGADWFLKTLVDADVANNALGWQWASGTGPDAAPYHRVFNPVLQGQKFDPNGDYRRRWLPEIKHLSNKELDEPWLVSNHAYPAPLLHPSQGRQNALARLKKARA